MERSPVANQGMNGCVWVEEGWEDAEVLWNDGWQGAMNDVVLKNVWTGDFTWSRDHDKIQIKHNRLKEITIRPMIVSIPACFRLAGNYESPLVTRAWPLNRNFASVDETLIDVLSVHSENSEREGTEYYQWLRAGPRKTIKFDTTEVVAAIVTCGGLCPGLNNVIREITTTLIRTYQVTKVYGIPYGYKGFYSKEWKVLDLSVVRHIHKTGGTILGTSRGGFDLDKIIDSLVARGVNQLYVIGGDGTHRGANRISEELERRGLPITIAGVPKTIDNDVPFIDRSFGFDSAVEEAVKTIGCALTEATNVEDGIGIVKLMGRECGFVALHATVAAGDVDVCLIPEVEFELEPLFAHIEQVLDQQGHCLIVVSEGAGPEHFQGVDLGCDASGNRRLPDVGLFLKDSVSEWFCRRGRKVTIRYMDPSYQIRSVRAIAADSIYCSLLGSNVVHGAMAGFSGFTCGQVNTRYVYIPMQHMSDPRRRVRVSPSSRMYRRMLRATMQPPLRADPPRASSCSPGAVPAGPAGCPHVDSQSSVSDLAATDEDWLRPPGD